MIYDVRGCPRAAMVLCIVHVRGAPLGYAKVARKGRRRVVVTRLRGQWQLKRLRAIRLLNDIRWVLATMERARFQNGY
jgi:hypothetical protein